MVTIKKILCPTDFSDRSLEGLRYAADLAQHFGAKLCLTNVVPAVPPLPTDPNISFAVPEYARALTKEADRKLRELVSLHVPKELDPRFIIGHGDAGTEIVRIAEEEGVDLIVIATQGLTGVRHFVFGSVAEKVVRLASCPVLTVRPTAVE
jgi:nucleotide-binding universal stress UspA family protein